MLIDEIQSKLNGFNKTLELLNGLSDSALPQALCEMRT
jgi:hypothetical protein